MSMVYVITWQIIHLWLHYAALRSNRCCSTSKRLLRQSEACYPINIIKTESVSSIRTTPIVRTMERCTLNHTNDHQPDGIRLSSSWPRDTVPYSPSFAMPSCPCHTQLYRGQRPLFVARGYISSNAGSVLAVSPHGLV